MKILLTGSTGFIGNHLTKKLLREKHEIVIIVRKGSSLSKEYSKIKKFIYSGKTSDLLSFFEKEKFDGVIHLASLFLSSHKSSDIENLINSNVLFSTQLLECATQANVKWFINTGTVWQHYKNSIYSPVNLYASTKQAFLDIAKYYLETTSINFLTIELSDTFGPGDKRPKIFNLWLNAIKNNEVLKMSPGKQKISLTYIDDITDAYIKVVKLLAQDKNKKLKGKTFSIVSEESMSLRNLAKIFEKTINKKIKIEWGALPYRIRENMDIYKKGKKIPGWTPKVKLVEGIKKTYE